MIKCLDVYNHLSGRFHMQLAVSSVSTSSTGSTGRGLSNTASGRSGLDLLVQAASFCCQESLPDDAVAACRSDVRRTAISDFDVMLASAPETVLAIEKDKKDEASNADKQSRSTVDTSSSRRKKKLKCEFCNHSFSNLASCDRHKKVAHGVHDKGFECDKCDESFDLERLLQQHKKNIHDGVPLRRRGRNKPFSSRKQSLMRHNQDHTGDTRFQCKICDKTFTRQSYRNRHEKQHSGNSPERCSICHRGFLYHYSLLKHMQVHEVGKDRKCKKCGESLVGRVAWSVHRITCHRKGKLYSCPGCQKGLSSRKSLKRHMRGCRNVDYDVWPNNMIATTKENKYKNASVQTNIDSACQKEKACSRAGKRKTRSGLDGKKTVTILKQGALTVNTPKNAERAREPLIKSGEQITVKYRLTAHI